ncbi:MAG: peroxidase [Gammaproteobacteria bacterium]|jgi:uncharacterized peroxidase-related enzyme|nr:peroxidase [Gammaproteobacteria bacterium]
MPNFSFLSEDTMLEEIFHRYPERYAPLSGFVQDVMRGNASELEVRQRELIAAFVSGLNECSYCYGAHSKISDSFGFPESLIKALLEDIDSSSLDSKLKPLFKYLQKITQNPGRVVQSDVQLCIDAGWSERAIEDAMAVCALFNMVNRIVLGYGLNNIWTPKRNQHIDNLLNKGYA